MRRWAKSRRRSDCEEERHRSSTSPRMRGEGAGSREARLRHKRGRAMNPLLCLRGVKAYYGNIIALRGIDVDVNQGEIVALIGANGTGKSTLMMTIFGKPRAREGSILF